MILRFYSVAKRIARFMLFVGLFSCISQIEIPIDVTGGRLVVSGKISTISDQNILELGISVDSYRLPIPLSGASVKLLDDSGTSYPYSQTTAGVYMLSGINGIQGRSYHIEIKLPNGKLYKSLPEKLPTVTKLDSVNYEITNESVVDFEGVVTQKKFYKIYVNATLASSNTYLRWSVGEAFLLSPTDFPDPFGSIPPPCFIVQNADPQRVVLVDGSTFSTNTIKKQLIASREIDWTFIEKHYFTTYQSSITKDAYEYWRKVNILANQVGSIFDTPPAEIVGNVVNVNDPSEKVLGYFQSINQTFNRKAFYSTDLPFPLLGSKCDFDGDFSELHYPTRCIDCTSVRNSSFKRPSWF
jgi:hypothetical protein